MGNPLNINTPGVAPVPPAVYLTSLGCDKNRVDSEVMLGLLHEAGYGMVSDAADADVIVVNTCGFIRDAVEESIETILRLAEHKKNGRCKALVAAGCMARRYRDEIQREIPEIDASLDTGAYTDIVSVVRRLTHGDDAPEAALSAQPVLPPRTAWPQLTAAFPGTSFFPRRPVDGLTHVAYVKIAEGCDNRCTYCTIPAIKGPYRSRDTDSLLTECENLIARGARELVLVAQDTVLYGVDLYGEPRIHALIRAIAALEGDFWLRVMYAYPEHITPALIDVMAGTPNVCRYLDMPVQHSRDSVLRRMGRRSTGAGLRAVIAGLREAMPDISLRTTLMTGFPGETEEAFYDLLDFIREVRFDRLGAFVYSREAGTPAAGMKRQVKTPVKKERFGALMRLQQEIHRDKQLMMRGRRLRVITDAENPKTPGEPARVYTGRSYQDAYETDAVVVFTARGSLAPGDFAEVTITGSDEYDLYGVRTDEPPE